ncbi:MAG: FUSC family protein [Micrococcales bacterium]|nr:FUSC family protein [Micrococcales bacterium]
MDRAPHTSGARRGVAGLRRLRDTYGAKAVEVSRASAKARLMRLRKRLTFILSCAVGAAIAWWFARDVLHHEMPFFAPITAMICLGLSYGQRLRRAGEIMVGVAIGVFIGDVFVHLFGTGPWQILVVVTIAMSLAALSGQGALMSTQAGVQAVVVTTLVAAPGQAFTRWLDAVIGGSVGLLIAALAPATPVRRPRQQAATVLRELAATARDAMAALRSGDHAAAKAALRRARATEGMLDELRTLSAEGIAVVRLSPIRRRHLPGVQAIAQLLEPLDRATRNLRVLVRRTEIAVWSGDEVPASYVETVDRLADLMDMAATELHDRHLPDRTADHLMALGRDTAMPLPHTTVSAAVIRAQTRSMIVDLLQLTGRSLDEARQSIGLDPDGDDDLDEDGEAG